MLNYIKPLKKPNNELHITVLNKMKSIQDFFSTNLLYSALAVRCCHTSETWFPITQNSTCACNFNPASPSCGQLTFREKMILKTYIDYGK